MQSIRTDLAMEAMEAFEGAGNGPLPGVAVSRWSEGGVDVTEVAVTENGAAQALGKPKGTYLTLFAPPLRERDPDIRLAVSALLSEEIERLLPEDRGTVLVVGLGNRAITPDALGPLAIDRTLATRHLLKGPYGRENLNSVCAVAPGVLGITGVETLELVEGLVERVKPAALICVDSLAARDSARIGTTVQLTDTGIQPGAGVGNRRVPLTRDTLGVPVIGIGMPTVIYAATLARDAIAWLGAEGGQAPGDEELAAMERSLLGAEVGEMIVTPREVDALVQDAAGIIASAVNRALQPGLSEEELLALMD